MWDFNWNEHEALTEFHKRIVEMSEEARNEYLFGVFRSEPSERRVLYMAKQRPAPVETIKLTFNFSPLDEGELECCKKNKSIGTLKLTEI